MYKNKTIFKTIITIIFLYLGTRLLGFYRDAIIGQVLGANEETDNYFRALNLTTRLFLPLGSGIAITLIPILVKETNKIEKNKFINNILNISIVLAFIVIIIFRVSLGNINLGNENLLFLIKILTPSVLLIVLAYFFTGILQSNEYFVLPTLISVPYNILIIIYVFIGSDLGVTGLTIITLIGWLLQMLLLLPKVLKILKQCKFEYTFKIDFKDEKVQLFLRGLLLIVFVMSTNQITTITDNHFIKDLGEGLVTTFDFAKEIFFAMTTVIVYGIVNVMYPKFNKNYVKSKELFYESISKVLGSLILLLMPISFGLFLVSDVLIEIIFLSENFGKSNVIITANFLKIYGIYMLGFGVFDVLNKAHYTINNKLNPIKVSFFIVIVNFLLNYLFINILNLSANSIIVGTGVAFYIGIVLSGILFKKEGGALHYKYLSKTLSKGIIASTIMYSVVKFFEILVYKNNLVGNTLGKMIYILAVALLGIVIYFISLLILKEKTIMSFIKKKK